MPIRARENDLDSCAVHRFQEIARLPARQRGIAHEAMARYGVITDPNITIGIIETCVDQRVGHVGEPIALGLKGLPIDR